MEPGQCVALRFHRLPTPPAASLESQLCAVSHAPTFFDESYCSGSPWVQGCCAHTHTHTDTCIRTFVLAYTLERMQKHTRYQYATVSLAVDSSLSSSLAHLRRYPRHPR